MTMCHKYLLPVCGSFSPPWTSPLPGPSLITFSMVTTACSIPASQTSLLASRFREPVASWPPLLPASISNLPVLNSSYYHPHHPCTSGIPLAQVGTTFPFILKSKDPVSSLVSTLSITSPVNSTSSLKGFFFSLLSTSSITLFLNTFIAQLDCMSQPPRFRPFNSNIFFKKQPDLARKT